MKLTTKLSLAFGTLIVILIIAAGLSLSSLNELQISKNLLAYAEDINTRVLNIKNDATTALAQGKAEPIKHIRTEIAEVNKQIEKLYAIASWDETFKAIKEIEESRDELLSVLSDMEQTFTDIKNIDVLITRVGQAAYKNFNQLTASMQNNPGAYSYDDLMAAKVVEAHFMDMRVAACSLLLEMTDANHELLQNSINALKQQLGSYGNNENLSSFKTDINQYTTSVEDLINEKLTQRKLLADGNVYLDHTQKAAENLVKIGHEAFKMAKDTAERSLYISTFIALIISISLTVMITRNLKAQLGADPSELSELAAKVTAGNYDIDDGQTHIGVYNNIVQMVDTMKVALQFARNILASLPVPCAVFGPDNKLKFANKEMMNLLETSQKMEDCIGETSGQFMFRQENFNTATLKAINSKQQGRTTIEYITYKNNKLHVDAIAQPLTDKDGNITDVISVWNDITEQTMQAQKVAQAHDNMQNIAQELEQVANIASSASEQLSSQIELSERGAQDQAERVSSTATALEEMNATVLEIARNAGTTSDSAASVRTEASAGSESMQECVKAMQDVREESLKLQSEMNVLSDHAQAINEIMNVISDIADQTNLLALNAAIEAARAGDAGRGFAVVADEVRNLAEKTMTSTTDVGNAISAIQRSTADNTRLVMDAVEKIEKVTEMVSNAGEALLGIVQLADTTADQVRAIATASEEQSATSDEITQSVDSINNIAKENANNMQEARQAVEEVVNQTNVLAKLIEQLQSNK